MPLHPRLGELSVFDGDLRCRIGFVLFAGNGPVAFLDVIRSRPLLVLAGFAGMSASFLEWVSSRTRFGMRPQNASARVGAFALPTFTLIVTSLICLLLGVLVN